MFDKKHLGICLNKGYVNCSVLIFMTQAQEFLEHEFVDVEAKEEEAEEKEEEDKEKESNAQPETKAEAQAITATRGKNEWHSMYTESGLLALLIA